MDFIRSHINDFKELRNLRVEHEKLLTAYKSLQSKLKHEKEKHEKEIAEMKIDETEYLECIKEKESIIASKEQYISELEESHEKIQDKLGEKQKEIDILRQLGKSFDKERKQSGKLKNDYDRLKHELSEKKKEIEDLKSLLEKNNINYKQKLGKLSNWFEEKSEIEYLLIKSEEKNALLEEENRKNALLLEQNKEKIYELENRISLQKNILNEEHIRAGKKFILCAGRYKGGADIPIDEYYIRAIKGSGVLEVDKPEYTRLVMTSVNEAVRHEVLKEYHGLQITEETILTITRTVNIEFYPTTKYDFQNKKLR